MEDHFQVIIKGMINFIRTHDTYYGLDDIEKRLPKYFKAIMDSIKMADKSCVAEDLEKTKENAKNAMGYYKKAIKILRGNK